ncbi:hypothetical protein ACODT3_43130 [Streptomyces sp. 4.24]|uniref:hypothetical protein n=1 Tax=Streptomyces tritrimontium TaxID=3406573 RepID=UPI003BB62716
MDIHEQIEASRTWEHGDPGPRPYDPNSAELMRTAALLERMAALIKADPVASARVHAGSDPAILMGATRTSADRERLRLAFAEDPGMVLWLNESVIGREVLAQVEMSVDAPDPVVAEEAIRTAPTVQVAQWRRRWHDERMRQHEENLRYFASREHAARRQQTYEVMMAAFEEQHGRK